MVFIIGYVFGGFSKNPALKVITRIAVILSILFFIGTNVFLMHSHWNHRTFGNRWNNCDTTLSQAH
jgi:uncharacterized membrane protein